jgi:hypothetical protein
MFEFLTWLFCLNTTNKKREMGKEVKQPAAIAVVS